MSKSDKFILFTMVIAIIAFVTQDYKRYTWKQTQQLHRNLEFGSKPWPPQKLR